MPAYDCDMRDARDDTALRLLGSLFSRPCGRSASGTIACALGSMLVLWMVRTEDCSRSLSRVCPVSLAIVSMMSDSVGFSPINNLSADAMSSMDATAKDRRESVGILTFHRCINYGSYWQARCLLEGLSAMGVRAVLLDYSSPRTDRAEWRCALSPLLPVATSRSDYAFYKRKTRKFFDAIARLPLSHPFPLEDPAQAGQFGLVVVGSDEVWNFKHPWFGGCAAFYGEGLSADRLISYAATFGNFASQERLQGPWSERLRRFSRISVRDLNSARLIRETLALEPELVLDPCLQFPQPLLSVRSGEEGRHIAVYGHGFPGWLQKAVRRWADARGYCLISIGYRNDWVDRQWIDAGPEEFACFMASAKAVVTNFFHGCVFSLVYEKPFACVFSDYRGNKLRDLAEIAGAQAHVMSEAGVFAQLDAALEHPLNPTIGRRIAILRLNSSAYLHHVI